MLIALTNHAAWFAWSHPGGAKRGHQDLTMTVSSTSRRWVSLFGTLALAGIVLATLAPAEWVPRLGVHWMLEHFLGYFALSAIICLAWPRPFLVAGMLMVLAGVLEALQGATVDRTPDVLSALSGAVGVWTAALLVWLATTRGKVSDSPQDGSYGHRLTDRIR
jgi:hypothetical protein